MPTISELFDSMEYGPAPEGEALARAWLEARGRRFGIFVGGRWVLGASGEEVETINPATEEPLARVVQGSPQDVDIAVQAARSAYPTWRALSGHARARYLYAVSRHIQKHARLFSVLETLDNGKPIRESRDIDIPLVARHFAHHAGWAQLTEAELPGHVPLGVVGQIIPWNFPLLMLAWKVAPALAMGNTVVLKPADFTPLTALLFAELCQDVGLPAGVFNVVTGDGKTGAALVEHPDVDKIAFTGSTEVGRILRAQTAGTGKRLSLELGGKSPFLVFDDADLDSVVEGVVDAIWFNQGQVCCAGSRILAQESIYEVLEEKIKARTERLRLGDPLDKSVDMGAIIAPVQLEKIRSLVRQGELEGARVWQPSWPVPERGNFFPPTLCTQVAPASTIAQVEIFGPVVVMMSFRTPAEAVELANDTRYGLAASVWTESVNLALDVAPLVKAGTVWVNSTNLFDAAAGFGGYRESGFGREGGREGLWEYVRPAWEERALGFGARAEPTERGPSLEGAPGAARPADVPGDSRTGVREAFSLSRPSSEGGAAGQEEADLPRVDRTAKLYIGGRQVRPDGGYSLSVLGGNGRVVGEVGRGNRKDIRNAVEAAHAARAWGRRTAHNRAQLLFFLAENLAARGAEFAARLETSGTGGPAPAEELQLSVHRLFHYAAWADKWDGRVHHTPYRIVTLAMPEPLGVMGLCCPHEAPLLGLVSLVAPAIAMGNTVVVVPSERCPLAATDFYQVLDTSDVPNGVVNIVTGLQSELAPVLASHDGVDGVWYFADQAGVREVERLSAGNMKRTWTLGGCGRDWADPAQGEGEAFLREATQIKNIWIPYGE